MVTVSYEFEIYDNYNYHTNCTNLRRSTDLNLGLRTCLYRVLFGPYKKRSLTVTIWYTAVALNECSNFAQLL